jgi:hypothetical protein
MEHWLSGYQTMQEETEKVGRFRFAFLAAFLCDLCGKDLNRKDRKGFAKCAKDFYS